MKLKIFLSLSIISSHISQAQIHINPGADTRSTQVSQTLQFMQEYIEDFKGDGQVD